MNKTATAVGSYLQEQLLCPLNISQSALAKALRLSDANVHEILHGERTITADTDLRLCKFFGLEDGFFLKLQVDEEILRAKGNLIHELAQIEPRKLTIHGKTQISVALICGGPSQERGISLNSARSIVDHLSRSEVTLIPLYVDVFKNFYRLSTSQVYSNTPSDFDFKLHNTATKLSEQELLQTLKQVDIVFPVIHGGFGEDGELQSFLEKHHIPFVGSDSRTCQNMFDKHNASSLLKRHGFPTIPTEVLRKNSPHLEKNIRRFFEEQSATRVVIKPIAGGSSIGVFSAYSPEEAVEKTKKLFDITNGDEALIEPFCVGNEFTIIVLQNTDGAPVSLIPTEIQVDYNNGGIFDYRRKYLPTTNTHWFCPPRFEDHIVEEIRRQAEELFTVFRMRDFARLDGWLLSDGKIIFSDFNPISGMEQNSFIFQQASRIGLSHADLLWNILRTACSRESISIPATPLLEKVSKEPVHILFGGSTAERQVSLMTGTNVWLKLRKSQKYDPVPFLLDHHNCVWRLPYTFSLNHTVEEIYENCIAALDTTARMKKFLHDIKKRLFLAPQDYQAEHNLPEKLSFEHFLELSCEKNAFVFLALHGGNGENGTLQALLEKNHLSYNGSNPETSALCMDKYITGQAIANMGDPSILTVPKRAIRISSLVRSSDGDLQNFWSSLQKELSSETFIVKPQRDGCSAGIVRLFSCDDLKNYLHLVQNRVPSIPANSFPRQSLPIEMPYAYEDDFLIEAFIETDEIHISKNNLLHRPKTGWIELTVGVLEKNGQIHSLNPSITVAEGEVLSVEEKFQGGTGINITPPLETIISERDRVLIKSYVEKIASALHIHNYARCDVFFNSKTKLLYLIEVNTLPALTPSTVLYHQALAETPPMYPTEFIEHLIEARHRRPL